MKQTPRLDANVSAFPENTDAVALITEGKVVLLIIRAWVLRPYKSVLRGFASLRR